MTSVLAIANAAAGTADDEAVDAAVDVLRARFEVSLARTSSPDDLKSALHEHPDIAGVVVLGGDGSLHAVVDALRSAERLALPIGLIPLGTGNDFAAALGLPIDPTAAAELIGINQPSRVDLIVDGDDRVVVNVAHIGAGADAAVAARPFKKSLGPLGYIAGAVIASAKALGSPGSRAIVTLDGAEVLARGRVLQIAVGNGRYVGGGGELLPDADPSDGQLDLMVTYAGPRHRRIAYAWKLRKGEQRGHADVVYRHGTEVTVTGDAMASTSDGELGEPQPQHAWRILPGALTMWR
ncbi:diacylglycerol/lipid kinase family protein [Aeromicrobium sp. P5_D10]